MTELCPSCREPVDHPSGDGCAAMTLHYALDPDLPAQLEALARRAETANYWTDEHRLMPAAGVADILYEALFEIRHHRGIEE